MQINWHGLSCFEMTAASVEGEVKIVTDPYANETGLRFPRTLEAQVVLVSHNEIDANNLSAIAGSPYVIDMPGEFEVRGVFFFGMSAPLNREEKGKHIVNHLFRIEVEGMHIAHLGAIDRVLTDEELQGLENIDILMVPVGGGRVLSPKLAAEVIAQIEPRVVIPMTFDISNLKEKLESIDVFCKELGACRREEMNKYKVSRKDLPEEDMLIVTLTR